MQQAEEQLSALVDDELDVPPTAAIGRLLADEARRRQWSRYHLIGDVLRDRDAPLDLDLAGRISAAIDEEPALLAPVALPARTTRPAPLPPAQTGRAWAVAAGLAAVGITGLMFAARAPEPAPATAPVAQVAPLVAVPAGTQFVTWDPAGTPSTANPQTLEFQRRLNSYLVNFNEQRSNLGVPGVHPYVRIVGFEAEAAPEP